MKTQKIPSFFKDQPLFGLDVGHGSIKVMQLERRPALAPKLIGYGTAAFDKSAQADGAAVKPEVIAAAAKNLFANHLIGDITTRRVAFAIPGYRTFTRSIQLPKLNAKDLHEAVMLEAEQYIPQALEELYLDYETIRQGADSTEVLLVATPRAIVDSYLELSELLGLEAVLIEPTLSSAGRLFTLDTHSNLATVIIDFGSLSADISIFDGHLMATGTVPGGGEVFTQTIKRRLNVTLAEAGLIKTKYGLGVSKKQKEIVEAMTPVLEQIVREIRRMVRYYEERYGNDRPIGQIVTLGGGANMPGLSDFLTNAIRLPVRHTDPWNHFEHKGLQPPSAADKPMYATAAGLSLAVPKEVFAHD